jgi:hypothetical protein
MVAWIKDDIGLEWFRIWVIWVRGCHTQVSKETLNEIYYYLLNNTSVKQTCELGQQV